MKASDEMPNGASEKRSTKKPAMKAQNSPCSSPRRMPQARATRNRSCGTAPSTGKRGSTEVWITASRAMSGTAR